MKFTLALLAIAAIGVSAQQQQQIVRGKHSRPYSQTEQQWTSEVPEINQPKINVRSWKDGSEYRYLYDGQILTGMPDVHLQFSGARIRAIVKIQAGPKDLMQIEKVFVGSLHERFVSNPQTLIQLDAFEPMQEQDAPFEEVLRKPVRFTTENGKVDNFETTEDDPSWSINIKRAILNTFHLSLVESEKELPKDQERREALSPRQSSENRPRPAKTSSSDDTDDYYTVVEDSIAGRCEVSYLVLEQPNTPEAIYPIFDNENETESVRNTDRRETQQSGLNVMNVTKTFDYRNCEFQPFVFKGLHLTSTCPSCESNPEDFFDILESAAHTRYNITGARDSNDFLIDSAITEAVYKVTPRAHYAGSMLAYANITLVLIQSGSKTGEIQFPEANANQIDGLHMINPRFFRREGDKFLYESPEASNPIVQKKQYWPNVDEKPRKIKALVEKLVQGMEEKEIKASTSLLVKNIVHLLEYAFEDELVQAHEAIKSINVQGVEKEEIEHIFIDLLVSTGSNCTFSYLRKLLVEKKLEGPVVIDTLTMLPFRMDIDKINANTLTQMASLCRESNIDGNTFTKRACWLSYGTLVHKACAHRTFDDRVQWKESQSESSGQTRASPRASPRRTASGSSEPRSSDEERENRHCPADVRRTIVEKISEQLKKVDQEASAVGGEVRDEKMILLIKVLGNMGLEETVDQVAEIALDESERVYIRTQAIYAMHFKGIRNQRAQEVLEVLLPLYRESKNPTQVRIAAFLTILASKPELPVIQDIAQSLNREIDLDVASYVYSSLSSVANSTDPCLKNLTQDVRLALELTTPINIDWRHSTASHHGAYLDHMKSGIFWEVNRIMDKDAPVPRAGNFRLHANINEKSMDLLEFGFETEGFGSSIRKYFGEISSEHIADVLAGRAARVPREAAGLPVQNIGEIDGLLKIASKEPKLIYGSAYLKVFGQQTRFAVVHPTTVARVLGEILFLQDQSNQMLPKLTSGEGLNMDNRRAGMLIDTKLEFPTVLGVPVSFSVRLPMVAGIKGKVKVVTEPRFEGGIWDIKKVPEKVAVETEIKTSIAGELHAKLSVFFGFLKFGTGVRTQLSLNMPINGKVELSLKDRSTKITTDLPENPIKLLRTATYPVTFVTRLSKNSVTYQPKSLPQGLEPHQRSQSGSSSSSEEQIRRNPSGQQESRKTDKWLDLDVEQKRTEMITKTGHCQLPQSFTGLPVQFPEVLEIATPAFVKSRDVDFQIGHDSLPVKFNVESETEYPNTRLAPHYLPVVGAKNEFEIKMTPKSGAKKIVITVFERTEFTTKPEPELLNNLKDKVADLTIKGLEKPNTPKDYEKFPKLGHSLQILVAGDDSDAPNAWTTRGLLALLYSIDGRYIKLLGAMDSKQQVLAKKICLNAELRYPDRNGMWFVTPQEALNKSIQGEAQLQWGDDCSAEKQIKIRLRYQKTDEQTKVEKFDLYDVNGIPIPLDVAAEVREGDALFQSLFKQCEEDRKIGAPFSKECIDLAVRYADLLRLKLDIDYKNVSPSIRKALARIEAIAQGVYFWNTEVENVDVKNPENKVSAIIEYSADRSYVDLKYKTPSQNVNIMNIDLPFNVQPASALFPWSSARLVGLVSAPSCTISGPKISTFDDVSDFVQLSQCYHLMAKDNQEDNIFAVLVANVAKNSLAKKVLVMFDGHRIEFVPKTEGSVPAGSPTQPIDVKSLYVVKHNGQVLADALTPEKRTTIPPNTPEDKEHLAAITLIAPEVSGNKDHIIGLFSHATGVKVLFDGSSVTILPSPLWKNNLVGLCGTYNGQTWDDRLLPNKSLAQDREEFSRAFLLNANGCDKEISPIPLMKPLGRRQ